jgi:hypothetical protein
MKSVTTAEGRGPRTGSSRKHTNPTLDTATNPVAYRRRSDRVLAIQGSAINRRYTDWYAQIQRGLKSIARSSADSGSVRGLNSRKCSKAKYGTQKNTVSTTISAVFTFHMDSITRPAPCRADEPAGRRQTARTRESS